jgi:hypothetical protein
MDYQTKKKGKQLYSFYMSTQRSDFETREEYIQEKKEIASELKALIGIEYVEDAEVLLYSENQLKFISDARENGYDVMLDYSGRGMYGETCPAVHLDRGENMRTMAKYQMDSMGLGSVAYAQY